MSTDTIHAEDTGREQGPICIPVRGIGAATGLAPGRPAAYGRYEPIDLDENNSYQLDEWCRRHPHMPRPHLGWGVCRSGFGLQSHQGVLSRAEAEEWAQQLNAGIVIGDN